MLKNISYQSHGRSDDNAPCLVLIHGLFGSADNLSVIRRHFEKDYRVINVDLPDHGVSPWSEKFSFDRYAKKIILTLESIGVSKASIVGHSLGGKVAMWIAYLNPTIVNHLVCLDIAPASYEARHHNVISGLTSIVLSQIDSRKDAVAKLNRFIDDPGTQAFLLKSLYQDNGEWKWRFNLDLLVRDYKLLSDWSLSEKVVYKGKTLFVKGEKSDYMTRAHQATIIKQFPNAKAKIVDAGHWLHAEKPQIVNNIIEKFLLS